jgi:Tol biopolymer transport system component
MQNRAPVSTFTAIVNVQGDVVQGDFTLSMTQLPDTGPIEPPVEPPIEPPIEPPSGTWSPPTWLLTDKEVYRVPSTPKPSYLAPVQDPTFRTLITRITDDPGKAIANISGGKWGSVARHHYSLDQAWNADQSLLYLDTNEGGSGTSGGFFLDGETYQPRFASKNKPGSDVRWHRTDPALMYYAGGSRFGTWNPQTGQATVIQDFGSQYSELTFGPWKGNFSSFGEFVVLTGEKSGRLVAFAFDVGTGHKFPDIEPAGDFSSASISPLGKHISFCFSPDIYEFTDLEGRSLGGLPSNYVSHADMIVDPAGDEVICGRVNSSSVGQGPSGLIAKYRIPEGRRTALTSGGWCSHTSARAQAGRWCASDAYPFEQGGQPPYDSEIIMADLEGSAVYRICHHHSGNPDYSGQPQPSMSPDGGRIIFASAWEASGSRPVGCFVADFRK